MSRQRGKGPRGTGGGKLDIDGMYEIDGDGCWMWMRALTTCGYGRVRRGGVMHRAHRYSWSLVNGPIPDGMTVDHLCFKRTCVNPDHLRLLTHLENATRQRSAISDTCSRGHTITGEQAGGRWRLCLECQRSRGRIYDAQRRARKREARLAEEGAA